MERKTLGFIAILTAAIPFVGIIVSHTSLWPEAFARVTDVYMPHGPTLTFSDFSPGQRTGVLENQTRQIIGSPVYLLFQPRRHSRYIHVDFQVDGEVKSNAVRIGYRDGSGPEGNILLPTTFKKNIFSAKIPFSEMTRERIDARRIVFEIPSASSVPVRVRSVRLYYDDK